MIKKTEQSSKTLDAHTVNVRSLLENRKLAIPHYQRPYKWQKRHVAQLVEDVQHFSNRSAYRLGSLVLHQNDDKLEIVDGQQRIITLTLILKAYMNHQPTPENIKLRSGLKHLKKRLFNPRMDHPLSQKNIVENYRFIEQRIGNLEDPHIIFLLEKCEFVQFTLQDLSTAFQFFDSQNARGKDLEPHDLLKAFHLRAFSPRDEPVKERVIDKWENTETKKLAGLFQYYLFRIRSWTNHNSARYFTKAHVKQFKGIDLDHSRQWPFTQMIRITDVHTKMYNQNSNRELDGQEMEFPFHLELPLINGRLFFEMVSHYLRVTEEMWELVKERLVNNSQADKIVQTMETYEGRKRDGDKYLRQLFDATLLQYIDKFGYEEVESVICHLFIWAYRVRLEKQRVELATMDNHAFGKGSYVNIIKNALHPREIITQAFPMRIELRYEKTQELQATMKDILGEKIFDNV